MTRFARAKGSKASNERVPEDASSWVDMKEQLVQKQKEKDDEPKRKEFEAHRVENYKKFLEESKKPEENTWADFPNAVKIEKNGKPEKLGAKKSGKYDMKPLKPLEELTQAEMKKYEKKRARRMRQQEKRAKLKAEGVGPKNEEISTVNKEQNLIADVDEQTIEGAATVAVEKRRKQRKRKKNSNAVEGLETPTAEKDVGLETPLGNGINKKLKGGDEGVAVKKPKQKKEKPKKTKIKVGGEEIDVTYFDGFPIKTEDAERLTQLKKQMISKGLPRSEVQAAMKLERRRAEKSLTRAKKNVCYNCRQSGHMLSECPSLQDSTNHEAVGSGICFKCGSTEHTHFECKVVRNQEFRFATCFICKEQGHISKQCPDNPKGLYPKGGGCNMCGDVTHLKKDCPKLVAEKESQAISLDMISGADLEGLDGDYAKKSVTPKSTPNKIVKF